MERAVIFGGSGFIGGYIVSKLVSFGYYVSIFTRDKEKAAHLKLLGNLGQVEVISGILQDLSAVEQLVEASDIVINLIGSISDTKNFHYLHVVVPATIAELVNKHKKKFIHFSAVGADIAKDSTYAASKLEGEGLVSQIYKETIIVRPNLVFGDGDRFFSKFARLAKILPFLPMVGGENLLQPVYVCDIADFILILIRDEVTGGVYEICGPKVYSLRDLMKFVLDTTSNRKPIIKIPNSIAKIMAFFCEFKLISWLLKPITGSTEPVFTVDQLKLTRYDLVAGKLDSTVITTNTLEDTVPSYLEVYKKR